MMPDEDWEGHGGSKVRSSRPGATNYGPESRDGSDGESTASAGEKFARAADHTRGQDSKPVFLALE
jgi:hypothetical protein